MALGTSGVRQLSIEVQGVTGVVWTNNAVLGCMMMADRSSVICSSILGMYVPRGCRVDRGGMAMERMEGLRMEGRVLVAP